MDCHSLLQGIEPWSPVLQTDSLPLSYGEVQVLVVTSIVNAQSLQSSPTLCNRMDCSLPGSSVHGFFREEYWSGLPSPPPGDLPDPGIQPVSLLGLLHCRRVHRGSPSIKKAMYYTSPLPTNCSANARIFCREGNANASNHCHPPTIASLPGPLLAPCLD